MLNVQILCVGSLKEKYLRDAVAEYEKRISGYAKLTIREFKDDKPITGALPPRGYNIALCVEGRQLSSEELAEKIEGLAVDGVSDISFVIGGSDGLDGSVKNACDLRLSFSRMTFPHQLMRVILCEQIYRAFTIINNGKYHK